MSWAETNEVGIVVASKDNNRKENRFRIARKAFESQKGLRKGVEIACGRGAKNTISLWQKIRSTTNIVLLHVRVGFGLFDWQPDNRFRT